MLRARLPLLALVTAIPVGGAHAGHAGTITAPFAPPTLIMPDGPPQVSAAAIDLHNACAAWRAPAPAASPAAAGASNWRLPIGVKPW